MRQLRLSRRATSILIAAVPLALLSAGTVKAGGPYDGTYGGALTGSTSNAPACAKTARVEMSVNDNNLVYHQFSNSTVTTTVGPDGSFNGTGSWSYNAGAKGAKTLQQTLSGKIVGTGLEATSVNQYCTYHLSLRKLA